MYFGVSSLYDWNPVESTYTVRLPTKVKAFTRHRNEKLGHKF